MIRQIAIAAASVVALGSCSIAPAMAGQLGTGARNTHSYEYGTTTRYSAGSLNIRELSNGYSQSTTLKQTCEAQPGSRCSYYGVVTANGAWGYQNGQANSDPTSTSTVTSSFSSFHKDLSLNETYRETYRGNSSSYTHETASFTSF